MNSTKLFSLYSDHQPLHWEHNFDEDSLDKWENNMYYAEKNNEAALQSFLHNLVLAKEIYPFTELERQAAPLAFLVEAASRFETGQRCPGKGQGHPWLD